MKGIPRSDEVKKKISKKLKGRTFEMIMGKKKADKRKKQHSEFMKTFVYTDERNKKISEKLKGHIVKEETRKKISEANKGKKRSEETRKKMSEQRSGENNCMFGKTHSPKVKEKLSKFAKKRMSTNEGKQHIENMIKAREGKQAKVKYRNNSFEQEVGKFLKDNLKIVLKPQFVIGSLFKNGCKIFDYKVKDKNVLIECNGDYWHCNPLTYSSEYLNELTGLTAEETWNRDKKKVKEAENNGYKVFVIWEDEFYNNKENILSNIKNII